MDIQYLEGSVIGSLLINGASQQSFDVLNKLNEEMFSIQLYSRIFKEIKQQALSKNIIDPILISEKFDGNDSANLWEAVKNCSAPTNITGYARILKESYITKKISILVKQTSLEISKSINFNQTKEIVDNLIKQVTFVGNDSDEVEPIHINDVLGSMMDTLQNRLDGKESTIHFSLPDLDNKIGGLEPSDLIIIAGRPSMGKTELALEAIKQMAIKNQGVLVFSLEMSANQLAQRQVASTGNIATGKFRNPTILDDEDWGRISAGIGVMTNLPIWMVDIADLTIDKIRNIARRHKQQHKHLSAIFIDYLQLIKPPKAERLDIAVGIISRELKAMAKELKCPVIALSQLSRKVEERVDKRPINSDLRNSGEIEQDADITMFLYRDEYYNENSEQKGIAEIIIGKARNGERGTVYMGFSNGHFHNIDQAHAKDKSQKQDSNKRYAKKAPF